MSGFAQLHANAHTTPGAQQRAISFSFGSGYTLVGTSTKLWVNSQALANAMIFTDRSKASFAGGCTSATMFGNIMIVACGTGGDVLQSRDAAGSSAFADIAAAPKAKYVVTQSNAVLAFNTDIGGNCFAASDVGDYTNWTTGEAVADTQIRHRPGDFTGAVAFRDYVLAFKEGSIYRVRYVGGAVKWAIELLVDGFGCRDGAAILSTGERVYFWDNSGPMVYDGSFRSILPDGGVDPSLGTSDLIPGASPPTGAIQIPPDRLIVWEKSSGVYLVYNETFDAWGKFTAYKSDGTALSSHSLLQTRDGTNGTGSTITRGGMLVLSLADAIYQSSLTIAPTGISSSLKTPPIGDEIFLTNWTRAIPKLLNPAGVPQADTTSTLASTDMKLNVRHSKNPFYFGENVTYSDQGSGVTAYGSNPVTSSNDQIRFDFNVSDRWADFEVYATAKFFEIEDLIIIGAKGGTD